MYYITRNILFNEWFDCNQNGNKYHVVRYFFFFT